MKIRFLICGLLLAGSLYAQSVFVGNNVFKGETSFGFGQGFTVSINPSTLFVNAGQQVSTTVTVRSIGNYNAAVATGCASAPIGISCPLSVPNPITPLANGNPITATLTFVISSNAVGTTCPGSGNIIVEGTSSSLNTSVLVSGCIVIAPNINNYSLNITTNGAGTITSLPSGISCPTACSATYAPNTSITLTATPAAGQQLDAWTGACAGVPASTSTCTFSISGNTTAGASFSGAPIIYTARTDTCVRTGSNCNGASTGHQGAALSFLGQTGDPMPWYQTPGTIDQPNTAITDPDFGSYQVVATSGAWGYANSFGTGPTASWNEQAGEFDPFSSDDNFLLVANNNGGWAVLALDTTLIHSKSCNTLSSSGACIVFTGLSTKATDSCTQGMAGTNCKELNSAGSFTFSRTSGESHYIYELMGSGTGNQVQVNQLRITCPSGAPHTWGANPCTMDRYVYVNFTSSGTAVLPTSYTSNSPWTGQFAMADDGTVGYAAGGAGDWQASTAYSNTALVDAFIYPSVNNTHHDGFQATVTGTSGLSEPNWDSVCATTCTDNTITWTNLGKIGSQGPGFDLLYYSPTLGARRLNTLTGYIFNASGYSGSQTAGYAVSDTVPNNFNSCLNQYDNCAGNVCTPPTGLYSGYTGGQISGCQTTAQSVQPFTDQTTLHDGGIKDDSTYFGWTPTGGGGNSGSFVPKVESCRNSGPTYPEISCYHYFWNTLTNTIRGEATWTNWTGTSVNGQTDAHAADGYTGIFQGGFSQLHLYSEPSFPNTTDYGSTKTCYSVSGNTLHSANCVVGVAFTGIPNLLVQQTTGVTGAPFDHHGADRAADTLDTVPIMYFNTAVPALGRISGQGYPNNVTAYNEIIGMAAQAVTGCSPIPGTYCQWRFGHNWGTSSVVDFYGQNELGMNSQDGTFAAFATDVMGTRGSHSPAWSAGSVLYGGIINPTSASNANHSSYQNLTASTFTAATEPDWSTCQVSGQTCTETGHSANIWTNVSQAATGSTGQLPCNGLRADLLQTPGSTINSGTIITRLSDLGLFKATTCNSCSFPVTYNAIAFPGSPTFMTSYTDSGASYQITYQFIGYNDCRSDVVVMDLTSASN